MRISAVNILIAGVAYKDRSKRYIYIYTLYNLTHTYENDIISMHIRILISFQSESFMHNAFALVSCMI